MWQAPPDQLVWQALASQTPRPVSIRLVSIRLASPSAVTLIPSQFEVSIRLASPSAVTLIPSQFDWFQFVWQAPQPSNLAPSQFDWFQFVWQAPQPSNLGPSQFDWFQFVWQAPKPSNPSGSARLNSVSIRSVSLQFDCPQAVTQPDEN